MNIKDHKNKKIIQVREIDVRKSYVFYTPLNGLPHNHSFSTHNGNTFC